MTFGALIILDLVVLIPLLIAIALGKYGQLTGNMAEKEGSGGQDRIVDDEETDLPFNQDIEPL
jgi:hypothetical protein